MSTSNRALEHATARAVAVREQIRAAKARHSEELKPLQTEFDTICGKILAYLKHVGVKSMKMDTGTAYQSTTNKASIADRKLFKDWVIATGTWEVLDWKVNANAAAGYAEANKVLPPGVNLSRETKLGVRSPGSKGDNDNDDE